MVLRLKKKPSPQQPTSHKTQNYLQQPHRDKHFRTAVETGHPEIFILEHWWATYFRCQYRRSIPAHPLLGFICGGDSLTKGTRRAPMDHGRAPAHHHNGGTMGETTNRTCFCVFSRLCSGQWKNSDDNILSLSCLHSLGMVLPWFPGMWGRACLYGTASS